MAKKVLRATPMRDRSREDESLLIRSAESLGRMIGLLQRQLDVATRRMTGTRADAGAGRTPVKTNRWWLEGKKRDRSAGTAKKSASSTAVRTSRRRSTIAKKR